MRLVIVTDSELRAAVEAAKAQGATFCRPDGILAKFVRLGLGGFLHLDSLHRTFLGAKSATDTSLLVHGKELGLPLVSQQPIGKRTEEIRHPVMALVALRSGFDHGYHLVYLRLGGIDLLLHFRGIGEVEHRRPVVRHLDRITGIHLDTFALQFMACVLAYEALQETIGGNTKNIVVLRQADVGFLDKLAYENRQFVPVGRGNESERLHISEAHLSRIVRQETGMTVLQWINSFRIKHAKQLLRYTRMSMSEIASDLHFTSTEYFRYFFRREAGMSPIAYRNS